MNTNKKEIINGLIYEDNFLTDEEEKNLIKFINKQKWSEKLTRRTQHYGFEYSYDKKNTIIKTEDIPQEFKFIVDKLNNKFNKIFDQLIINEYKPGQGISPHIDNTELFDDTIVSISLGSTYPMIFSLGNNSYLKKLKKKSLVGLTGDARYKWFHSIPSRKSDDGVDRGIRISLTFRIMKNNNY
jgi:alkylated DNA repair dioxygenase AlkB